MSVELLINGTSIHTLDQGLFTIPKSDPTTVYYEGDHTGYYFIKRSDAEIGKGFLLHPGHTTIQYGITLHIPPIERGQPSTPINAWLSLRRT